MKTLISPLFICIWLCVGCFKETPKQQERILAVSIAKANLRENVPVYLDVIGSIKSQEIVELRPSVSGVIVKVFAEEGTYIKKGDPLFLIDPRPYEAALNKAKATLTKDQASLAFAAQRLERYEELVKQEYFSKLNYEQYKSEFEAAKAQILIDESEIATAALNLEWAHITSPIDGKLSMKNFDLGNLVAINSAIPLTTIRQITPIDVFFSISQTVYVSLQEVAHEGPLIFEVYLPHQEEKLREGMVNFIDNQVNPSTGTILLRGSIANEDELFWPGEFVRVRLRLAVKPQTILIPNSAVQIGQQGSFVYVYDFSTSRVEYRLVKKGPTVEEGVIIESGIKEGEHVVTKGQLNLRPGVEVSVE